jgi:hypothetical protein
LLTQHLARREGDVRLINTQLQLGGRWLPGARKTVSTVSMGGLFFQLLTIRLDELVVTLTAIENR